MKKVISSVVFLAILIGMIVKANDIFVDKSRNRYYMLSQELNKIDDIDIQVYGSCHAYTSFDAKSFTEEYGISSYNMSNPGEIMPTTYLRMMERFKRDIPEVALVEIWGTNAYETYDSTEDILGRFLKSNVEDIPLSIDKLEVIADYETLDIWEDNFALFKYKSRLLEFSLTENDFNYSFERAYNMYNTEKEDWLYNEMENRFENNGFFSNDSQDISDYAQKQATVERTDVLEVEADLMKYLDKVIGLCEENNVELIFYRAPYISTENELRKKNYLEQYFEERNIPFYDLEREITYDYTEDFEDYYHLSKKGAAKSTEYLGKKIIDLLYE